MSSLSEDPASPDALPMSVAMSRQRDFLVARVTGFHTPGPVAATITAIRSELSAAGLSRLLLDLRELVGVVTASDHMEDATLMVQHLRDIRWATLVRMSQYSGAGQRYCHMQGCVMDTFFDEEAAVAWLESDRPPGA